MNRPSNHVEPKGLQATARHYIRDLVYGANDGIVTTFAVVAGVTGGSLSHVAVLVVGTANLAADGISMAAGNYLSIRADESARAADNRPEEEAQPMRHALATLVAFVSAGSVPLAPYVLPVLWPGEFVWSSVLTLATLFIVGAARGTVTRSPWWKTGLETLVLGAFAAMAAYAAGFIAAAAMS